ncbi:RNA-binding protein 39 isoform X2 [Onthophagus taurus]|uniref:RNA-binding protein 39 isoform X2 n=1 Tax=Onthophagus taurus TaxID=166361 RepID=UPI000C2075B6|nr:RNA-binding protein 39 isoform X2 [Onthophagus taurus]
MAEDIDVEAMLEAPYKKEEEINGKIKENGDSSNKYRSSERNGRRRSRSNSRRRSRSRSKDRRRTSRDRRRSRSRERRRSKDRNRSRERRSRSRSKKRSRSRDVNKRSSDNKRRNDRRSRSRERRPRDKAGAVTATGGNASSGGGAGARHTPSPPSVRLPFPKKGRSPIGLGYNRGTSPPEDLSPEERDARTVFVMQLSQRIRARDLEEFFSSVGKVRDVRLITCNKTRRFKGIAYIEFRDPESVALALGLSGQKLLGVPIIVQHTQAEKNRMGNSMPNLMPKGMTGPMRLYVGSLHFNITEDMLRGIFEPYGKIDNIQLIMDPETGRSKGYGFITFHNCDDAKKALEQLNGFELAGRPMKVGNVTERLDLQQQGPSILDSDELDRSGIDLGATGRLQLMFKLAEGAGMQVPQAAANALSMATGQPVVPQVQTNSTPPIATQCFMLSNMFDPTSENQQSWDTEIRDDVIEECNKHGGVLHVFVDKGSPQGNVYVKCPSIATAVASVNSLHGRWFAGRVITAAYVPLMNYHALFPDAMSAQQLLLPSTRK